MHSATLDLQSTVTTRQLLSLLPSSHTDKCDSVSLLLSHISHVLYIRRRIIVHIISDPQGATKLTPESLSLSPGHLGNILNVKCSKMTDSGWGVIQW